MLPLQGTKIICNRKLLCIRSFRFIVDEEIWKKWWIPKHPGRCFCRNMGFLSFWKNWSTDYSGIRHSVCSSRGGTKTVRMWQYEPWRVKSSKSHSRLGTTWKKLLMDSRAGTSCSEMRCFQFCAVWLLCLCRISCSIQLSRKPQYWYRMCVCAQGQVSHKLPSSEQVQRHCRRLLKCIIAETWSNNER